MLTVPKSHKKSKKKTRCTRVLTTSTGNQLKFVTTHLTGPPPRAHLPPGRDLPVRATRQRARCAKMCTGGASTWRRTAVEVEAPDGASSRRATAALAL